MIYLLRLIFPFVLIFLMIIRQILIFILVIGAIPVVLVKFIKTGEFHDYPDWLDQNIDFADDWENFYNKIELEYRKKRGSSEH